MLDILMSLGTLYVLAAPLILCFIRDVDIEFVDDDDCKKDNL